MELKWLEDVLSLSTTLSFSRAARERNITQSALSRRVKQLEDWLGSPLFDRSSYPIRLTEAGRTFLPRAQEIIRQVLAGLVRRIDAELQVPARLLHRPVDFVDGLLQLLVGSLRRGRGLRRLQQRRVERPKSEAAMSPLVVAFKALSLRLRCP